MTSSPEKINKAMGDAEKALSDLDRAFTSYGEEVDYLPRETVVLADNALKALNQLLNMGQVPVKELKGRGSILNVMDRIGPKLDDPATQTMLGTQAVEFSGIFHSVHNRLAQKDPKKVESTLFGHMDKK